MMRFNGTIFVAGVAAALLAAPSAVARDLPEIKTSPANAVPECATPGRLMAFLQSRNKRLDPRYGSVAADYMRHGEALGLRWDIAFFQMMVETGNLGYTGDVKPGQNNFAGLGATGGGVPGESFPDISTGVLAHLQHVLLYAGEEVANPVAERTRKVQEWNIIKSWYKDVSGPRTFSHLAKRWAPGSSAYPRDIASVAKAFMDGACIAPDPRPEMAELGRDPSQPAASAEATGALGPAPEGPSVADDSPPRQSADEPGARPDSKAEGALPRDDKPKQSVTILNEEKPAPGAGSTEGTAAGAGPAFQSANAAGAAMQGAAPPPSAKSGAPCRVWTASYGGNKAIIIKAMQDKTINYTVLDVNEGKEKSEAQAYITAYAKEGETVGEFTSQTLALEKAFELCPEG